MIINDDLDRTRLEFEEAERGIRSPRVVTLAAGDAIFRFAGTSRVGGGATSSREWAWGAWWLPEEAYRLIIERHRGGGLPLGAVGRAAAAVVPSWNLMDVSIKARLRYDVRAYMGAGRPQYRDLLPNGMYMTIRGWPDIEQIYIPNLRARRDGSGPGPAFLAIEVVRQKVITSDGSWR